MANHNKGKTHFAYCDKANESDNNDYWGTTYCGLKETESDLTDQSKYVTCKTCLKILNKIEFLKRKQQI